MLVLLQGRVGVKQGDPSGCLAAQIKRWAEGIRVPGSLAGGI